MTTDSTFHLVSTHHAGPSRMQLVLIVAVLLLTMSLPFLLASAGQAAEPVSKPDAQYNPPDGAIQATATMLTIPYAPIKATVALAGVVIVGLDYLFTFGQGSGASFIWRACTGGDYAITKDHLTGQKPLRFLGFLKTPSG